MSLETKPKSAGSLIKFAIDLLSQQCWCWGQDILRPQGNWLMEIGLERIPPPEPYRERGSVYRCSLPHGGSILLRGFGVLIGRPESGGVFLPRYEFTPRHTSTWPLESLPWATAVLPDLQPLNRENHDRCATLTLELLDWITDYERQILKRPGSDYRAATLREWEDGERYVIPADKMARAWEQLTVRVRDRFARFRRSADVMAEAVPILDAQQSAQRSA